MSELNKYIHRYIYSKWHNLEDVDMRMYQLILTAGKLKPGRKPLERLREIYKLIDKKNLKQINTNLKQKINNETVKIQVGLINKWKLELDNNKSLHLYDTIPWKYYNNAFWPIFPFPKRPSNNEQVNYIKELELIIMNKYSIVNDLLSNIYNASLINVVTETNVDNLQERNPLLDYQQIIDSELFNKITTLYKLRVDIKIQINTNIESLVIGRVDSYNIGVDPIIHIIYYLLESYATITQQMIYMYVLFTNYMITQIIQETKINYKQFNGLLCDNTKDILDDDPVIGYCMRLKKVHNKLISSNRILKNHVYHINGSYINKKLHMKDLDLIQYSQDVWSNGIRYTDLIIEGDKYLTIT